MRSKPKNASRFAKRIFLCFSHLRLRRRFHLSAGLYALRGRNTSCEAANRRNEKKAFSEAASFFPFRLPLRGLKGASSPFLVDPARRNRWWFSGSLLTSKENISLNEKALCPAPPAREPFLVLFWHAKENLALRNNALYLYYTPNPPDFYDQVQKPPFSARAPLCKGGRVCYTFYECDSIFLMEAFLCPQSSVCFAAARILLAAVPTAPPCFRHWRRSSLLRFFLVSPICCFAADFRCCNRKSSCPDEAGAFRS